MKCRNLIIILAIYLLCSSAWSQEQAAVDLTGDWLGTLSISSVKLRIVFHISRAGDVYSAKLDSPDQGAKDIPTGEVTARGDSLTIQVPAIRGRFLGLYRPDSSDVAGQWQQGGLSLPLILRRTDTPVTMNRPQEPVKPYPYVEEEVSFANDQAKVRLAGTLTLPAGKGPFPAVVLISGSGPQNRDELVFGHRPFLILADHLTRAGVVVLRFDDRGAGQSTGVFAAATSADFAGDVAAAVDYLRSRTDIDRRHIGLIGHSEGGIIAPMVAAARKDIAFIVLLAGPGETGEKIILSQSRLLMQGSGMAPEALEENMQTQAKLMHIAASAADTAVARQEIRALLRQQAEKEGQTAELDKNPQMLDVQVSQLLSPWFRFFLNSDPAVYLKKVKCPVLALDGELDMQVPAEENLRGIEAALKAGGQKPPTIYKLPGLNHLFQNAKTGMPQEYTQIEETMSPKVLQIISDWIKERL